MVAEAEEVEHYFQVMIQLLVQVEDLVIILVKYFLSFLENHSQ